MLIGVAGCGGSAAPAHPAVSNLFGYDAARPLRFVDRGRVNHGYPVVVDDVSYSSGRDRIAAYLVLPPGRRQPLPAVVYLHGTGGDRAELLVQSTWLVARGAVALTITAPSAVTPTPRGLSPVALLRWQVQIQKRDVVAVRRALDLLSRRRDVDPARIGFVGWSAGAHTGAILVGVEPRLRAIVLMSGGIAPLSAYTTLSPAALRAPIKHYLGSIDPLHYLRQASTSSLFLQDGRNDAIVPRAALLTFAHATPHGTRIRWYDAGHALNNSAYRDQLAWLTHQLRINGPVVAGARTGP
jgi:predicted esterase